MLVRVLLAFFEEVGRGVGFQVLVARVRLRRFFTMIYLFSVQTLCDRYVVRFVLGVNQVIVEIYVFLVGSLLRIKVRNYRSLRAATMGGVNDLYLNVSFGIRRITSSLVNGLVFRVHMGNAFFFNILGLYNLSAKVGIVVRYYVVFVL